MFIFVSDAELAADTSVKSIAFSSMSSTQANKLLQEVHLVQVDGPKAAPFTQTAGKRRDNVIGAQELTLT